MPDCMTKVSELRARFPDKDIQVDGGVGPGNIQTCAHAGKGLIQTCLYHLCAPISFDLSVGHIPPPVRTKLIDSGLPQRGYDTADAILAPPGIYFPTHLTDLSPHCCLFQLYADGHPITRGSISFMPFLLLFRMPPSQILTFRVPLICIID